MNTPGANLILQRQGQDKFLNVQPQQSAQQGVGIQLQAPPQQQPAQAPPRYAPPPPQHRAPVAAHRPQNPPQQPPQNEEELLNTMNEFANPLKKAAPRGRQQYSDDESSEGGDGAGQEEFEEDGGSENQSDDGQISEGGSSQQYEGFPEAAPAPYVEKPSEGFRSLEEEKSDIMFKLQRLQRQGVRGLRAFTPYSDIRDMRSELSRIKTELELERSVKFQRKILMAIVSAMEWGNTKFNPFDLELDGWSEQMHQSVQTSTEYDGIFEELFMKYRGKMSTPPEIRLLLMVGGSAMMFHMTKAMMKSALPNIGDMMRQNPDMMATMMKSMGGGGMGGDQPPGQQTNTMTGGGGTERREMRGPGLDIGGLMGGGGGGGLGGLMGGGGGGGGLGGLMGGMLGGGGGGGGLMGMGGISASNVPPPPPPNPALNPMSTRGDRAPPPRFEDMESDRLSDVLSDDLGSIPESLDSVRSDSTGRVKNVRITVPPTRKAKKQKTTPAKKVIVI